MAQSAQQAYLVETDSSARRAAASAVGWLPIAVTVGLVVQAMSLAPGLSGGIDLLSYPRLRALADTLAVFGWLTTAAFAAVFAIVPRVAGVQLHNERAGRLAILLWNLLLFAGIFTLLLGMNAGRPLGELPVALDWGLTLVMAMVAYNAAVTLARRTERTMFVSALYLLAAVVFLPVVFVIGNIASFPGLADVIASGFYTQGLWWLWLTPAFVGAAYWIVPTATGNPLHSRSLAVVGFWSLLLVGGWTGQAPYVWGPTQPYLQTVAIVMSGALLVPVLSVSSNLLATARGRWGRIADDFGLRFAVAGLGFLIVWTVLSAVSAERSVARVVGLTAWTDGLRHMGVYGVFTCFAAAVVYHLFPRLTGRSWYSRRAASLHFWATIAAVAAGAALRLASGLVRGSSWLTFATVGDLSRGGDLWSMNVLMSRGFDALALLAFAVLAVAQYVFAVNAFRTARRGDEFYLVEETVVVTTSPV